MSRSNLRAAAVAAAAVFVFASCSSDAKTSPTTSPTTSPAATVATAGDTTGDATVPTAGSGDTGEQDASITALSTLDGDTVCGYFPQDKVSAVIGIDAGEPDGSSTPGLGSGCSYLVESDSGELLSAQLTFASFSWSTQKIGLADTAAACTIGGKDALCTDASKDGDVDFPASVVVKLGGDADYTMETQGETLDQAKTLAELALANIPA